MSCGDIMYLCLGYFSSECIHHATHTIYTSECFSHLYEISPVRCCIARESDDITIHPLVTGHSYRSYWEECRLYVRIFHDILYLWRELLEVIAFRMVCTYDADSDTRTRKGVSHYHMFSESELTTDSAYSFFHLCHKWFYDATF